MKNIISFFLIVLLLHSFLSAQDYYVIDLGEDSSELQSVEEQ